MSRAELRGPFIMVMLGWLAAFAAPCRAQCSPAWITGPDQGYPGVFSADVSPTTVYASLPWDPDGPGPEPECLVVAGEFTIAGNVYANRVAMWDGTTWRSIGNGLNLTVYALAVYNGQLIAGGEFSSSGSVSTSRLAAWDGAAWQPFAGGSFINGIVRALLVHDGSLIVAGSFPTIGGTPFNRIARWDGAVWHPFATGFSTGTVTSLVTFDGDLIAGGSFSASGSTTTNRVARWNGQAWLPMGTFFNSGGTVHALAVFDGQLIAGGAFSTRIARWTGTNWTPPPFAGNNLFPTAVYSLQVIDGSLYAGGNLSVTGTPGGAGLARWSGEVWEPVGPQPPSSIGPIEVRTIASLRDQIYVGGQFQRFGNRLADNIASFDGTDWRTLGGSLNGSPRTVGSFTTFNGDLVFSGLFEGSGGVVSRGITRWNGRDWRPLGADVAPSQSIGALGVYNDNLIIAGGFTSIDGVSIRGLAAWNGSTWSGFGIGLGNGINNPAVSTMAVYNQELIVSGTFTFAGGVNANNIARWDGATWRPLGSGLSIGASALTIYNGQLVAGGFFSSPGLNRLARWNGSFWTSVGTGVTGGTSPSVRALAVYNGDLIAAGEFTAAGGVPASNIARWNGSAWSALGSHVFTGAITTLLVADGSLYAAGRFVDSGNNIGRLARWDGQTWHPILPSVNPDPFIYALHEYHGELIVGGSFDAIAGQVSYAWARYAPHPVPTIVVQPPSSSESCVSAPVQIAIAINDGYTDAAYQWRRDSQVVSDEPGHITGSNTDTLRILAASEQDAGVYTCVVSTPCGETISQSATLVVQRCCAADFNGDDIVNSSDFFDYLNAFFNAEPSADFNGDLITNSQDFFDFLAALFEDC